MIFAKHNKTYFFKILSWRSEFFIFPRRIFSVSLCVFVDETSRVGGIFGLFLLEPFGDRQVLVISDFVSHFFGHCDVTAYFVDGVERLCIAVDSWWEGMVAKSGDVDYSNGSMKACADVSKRK